MFNNSRLIGSVPMCRYTKWIGSKPSITYRVRCTTMLRMNEWIEFCKWVDGVGYNVSTVLRRIGSHESPGVSDPFAQFVCTGKLTRILVYHLYSWIYVNKTCHCIVEDFVCMCIEELRDCFGNNIQNAVAYWNNPPSQQEASHALHVASVKWGW